MGTEAEPELYLQRDQPPGVPPLALTGERTLPDVPEENYWYQRHLVVYRWIAARVGGQHVVDVASGEGYGADTLAEHATSVLGIEPNPDAFEHAVARYPRATFRRALAEDFVERCEAITFLQTIEHVGDPDAVLEHFKSQLEPGGAVYVSTPNLLTIAPEGAEKSGNPWHVMEYRADEFRALCEAHFSQVEVLGLFHARKLRVHELAIRHARWDDIHQRLGFTKLFYDRFTPAIGIRDFALRKTDLDRALDFLAVCRP
ncbi:MAG: class I SAM-dependent methyltransferase [Solirubrobacteraceae bacterium]